ncbi:MAG: OmpA family protein [Kofleriaceae bacterium]
MDPACPACGHPIDPEQFDERGHVTCPSCAEALAWDGALRRLEDTAVGVDPASTPTAGATLLLTPLPAASVAATTTAAARPPASDAKVAAPASAGPATAPGSSPRTVAAAAVTGASAAAPGTAAGMASRAAPGTWASSAGQHTRIIGPRAQAVPRRAPRVKSHTDRWMIVAVLLASAALITVIAVHVSRRPKAAAPVVAGSDAGVVALATVDAAPAVPIDAGVVVLATVDAAPAVPVDAAPAMPVDAAPPAIAAGPRTLAIIRFALASAAVPRDAATRRHLADAVRALASSTGTLEVHGHTDDEGARERNMELSRERAEAVRAQLIDAGAAPARLRVEAHGPDQPARPGARSQNRRVELILTP